MNTNTPNLDQEKQDLSSPERVLGFLRQELINKGIASDKVDSYIIQNKEKLGIGDEVVKLMEKSVSEEVSEVEEKIESEKPIEMKERSSEAVDVESEMKKVKEEISNEEKEIGAELSSSEEEKVKVEQKIEPIKQRSGGQIKVDGYAPSQTVAQNSTKIAQKGDVNKSQTWQAVLIQRLEEIWGDIRGLFSAK
ncbi:MAG: hypothetical protein ABIC57_01200 [bacterium]